MPNLKNVDLVTVARWTAQDRPSTTPHSGSYDIVTRDVGATLGVGVYDGDRLIHSFYAHTRHTSAAEEITRGLISDTIERIQSDFGARRVAEEFPATFPLVVQEAGCLDLASEELA